MNELLNIMLTQKNELLENIFNERDFKLNLIKENEEG